MSRRKFENEDESRSRTGHSQSSARVVRRCRRSGVAFGARGVCHPHRAGAPRRASGLGGAGLLLSRSPVGRARAPAHPGARAGCRERRAVAWRRDPGGRRGGGERRRGAVQPPARVRPIGGRQRQATRLRAQAAFLRERGAHHQASSSGRQGRLSHLLRRRRPGHPRARARAGEAHRAQRRGHRRQG